MRARLFWKLGLTYLALMLGVLLAVDFYSARVLRHDYIRSANDELGSLLQLALARPPNTGDLPQLRDWVEWLSKSGARVTVIDSTGTVLADSAHDPETMENHSDRPEIQQAVASGKGQSVRFSATLQRNLVYQAVRYQPAVGSAVTIRVARPLASIDFSLAELRQRLAVASLVIFLIGLAASLLISRMFSARVERLTEFSKRVAMGDFRPLPGEESRDELAELGDSLNETAQHLESEIRQLSGERNRSSAILRSMVEGVAVIDSHEKLVFCNRAFSEILTIDSKTSEGHPLIEVVRNSELIGLIRKALKGQEGLQSDIATGIVQPRNFSVTAAPVKALETTLPVTGATVPSALNAAAEKPSGAVVVLHDVTELRRLERVRQDFVANVSHEFKTPLTAIQGFAETLLGGALEDPKNNRRFLEIMRDHATRLARLTDDLLKLARIEAGKLEVQFSAVGVLEFVERCAETALMKSSRKQITLEIEIPPGFPRFSATRVCCATYFKTCSITQFSTRPRVATFA